MKHPIQPFLVALAFTLITSLAVAETTVYGFELKNRMSVKGGQQYDLLLQEMADMGLEYQLKVLSFKRQVQSFGADPSSCIFPTSTIAAGRLLPEIKTTLLGSDRVDMTGLVILNRKTDPMIKSLDELEGKTIAMWIGLDPKVFLPGVKYGSVIKVPNDETLLRMLDRKRVDIILGFMPDILLAADKLDLPFPQSSNIWPITKRGTQLVCFDTPENRAFISEFNKRLTIIKASGKLREIMGPLVNLNDETPAFY